MSNRMTGGILVFAALSAISAACSTITLDPFDPDSTSVSTSASSSSGGTGGAPVKSALALRGSDFSNGSIPWIDTPLPWAGNPDWLVLLLASEATECASPVYPSACEGRSRWQTILALPPEVATRGLVDLRDPRVFVYEMGVNLGPGGCGRFLSGGNAFWGTLDIQQSEATSVTLSLADSGGSGHPPANGDWVAQRCGEPPAAPPTPAVAFEGTNLPPGGPQNPDPDALYVVVGTGAPTCASPFSDPCNGASRLIFSLPPALQKPGKIDLFDPAIAATYTITAEDGLGTCHTDTGSFAAEEPFANGYIEIQSIDAAQLSVRVYASYGLTEHGATFEADGHYTASLCP